MDDDDDDDDDDCSEAVRDVAETRNDLLMRWKLRYRRNVELQNAW